MTKSLGLIAVLALVGIQSLSAAQVYCVEKENKEKQNAETQCKQKCMMSGGFDGLGYETDKDKSGFDLTATEWKKYNKCIKEKKVACVCKF